MSTSSPFGDTREFSTIEAACAAASAPDKHNQIKLLIAEPGKQLRSVYLSAGEWKIGRDRQCEVLLGDDTASRLHCQLTIRDNKTVSVCDLGSRNGTRINGESIGADDRAVRFAEDTISCGAVRIKVLPA